MEPNVTQQISETGAQLVTQATESSVFILYFPYFLIALGILALLYIIRWYLHRRERISASFKRKVLLVMVPKEAEEEAKKKESSDQKKNIKETIGIMETLYASFSGIRHAKDWTYFLYLIKKYTIKIRL